MESAALRLLNTAVLRVALMPMAHALGTYHPAHRCAAITKPLGTAACGSAQHDARGGKLRQGMVCGIRHAAVKRGGFGRPGASEGLERHRG